MWLNDFTAQKGSIEMKQLVLSTMSVQYMLNIKISHRRI
jgi:hypothetical protein